MANPKVGSVCNDNKGLRDIYAHINSKEHEEIL